MQKDIWTGRIFMFPREYQNEKKSTLTSEYDFLTIHFDTRHFIYNRKAVLHLRKLLFYIRLSRCSTDVGERKIRLVTALDQIKNLIQIKYQRLLLIWAPISEIPSHIITLENAECYSFFARYMLGILYVQADFKLYSIYADGKDFFYTQY